MADILETIIAAKKKEIAEKQGLHSIADLERRPLFGRAILSMRDFLLDESKTGIIAEFKRRSPSKGDININADAGAVTAGYTQYGASALSVLTDSEFFGARPEDFTAARANGIPLLRKDFVIDEYQVIESKAMGADAILLIAACLSPKRVNELAVFANGLGLEVLLEIHSEAELEHISDATALVGINNRNLRDFKVDIAHSVALAEKIPGDKLKIAESGITNAEVVKLLRTKGFRGFLIGSNFMEVEDPAEAFRIFAGKLK